MLKAADVTRSVQSHAHAIKRQEFTKESFFLSLKPFTSARFGSSSSAALSEDGGFSMSSAPHLAHISVFTHIIRASVQFHNLFNGARNASHESALHIHTVTKHRSSSN